MYSFVSPSRQLDLNMGHRRRHANPHAKRDAMKYRRRAIQRQRAHRRRRMGTWLSRQLAAGATLVTRGDLERMRPWYRGGNPRIIEFLFS